MRGLRPPDSIVAFVTGPHFRDGRASILPKLMLVSNGPAIYFFTWA